MKFKTAAAILTSVVLSACGSSSSDDETTGGTTPEVDANIAAIAGVYDTTKDNDENYLYISEIGVMSAFNYEGDSVDNGSNCYSITATQSDLNGVFTTATVTYDDSTELYTVTNGSFVLTFEFDETAGMNTFTTSNITGGTGLELSLNGIDIKVGGSASNLKVSSPSYADIAGALCD